VDDTAGNGNQAAEPGESLAIVVAVGNSGNTTANGVTATLSTTFPGVTVTAPTATYPAIPAAGSAESLSPHFTVTLGGSVPCGSRIPFDVVISRGASVYRGTLHLDVGSPVGTVYLHSSFDTDAAGWTGDTGDNTAGDWIQGNPNVTARYNAVFQTGDPAVGAGCYFTGQNSNWTSLTNGDVAGGTAIALSPEFDLTAARSPALSFQRWFVSLWGSEQTADIFTVELTNGTDTVVLETLDHSEDAWVERRISLAGAIPFTSTMRVIFKASDLGTNGVNIVEAAIDEVRVEEYGCGADCTNPGVATNTLKASKAGPATANFHWEASGTGEWNVHRTDAPIFLANIWQDNGTVQTAVPQSRYDESGWPPSGDVLYYQVFGKDSCTGLSVP
jgi:hypothetical protein